MLSTTEASEARTKPGTDSCRPAICGDSGYSIQVERGVGAFADLRGSPEVSCMNYFRWHSACCQLEIFKAPVVTITVHRFMHNIDAVSLQDPTVWLPPSSSRCNCSKYRMHLHLHLHQPEIKRICGNGDRHSPSKVALSATKST